MSSAAVVGVQVLRLVWLELGSDTAQIRPANEKSSFTPRLQRSPLISAPSGAIINWNSCKDAERTHETISGMKSLSVHLRVVALEGTLLLDRPHAVETTTGREIQQIIAASTGSPWYEYKLVTGAGELVGANDSLFKLSTQREVCFTSVRINQPKLTAQEWDLEAFFAVRVKSWTDFCSAAERMLPAAEEWTAETLTTFLLSKEEFLQIRDCGRVRCKWLALPNSVVQTCAIGHYAACKLTEMRLNMFVALESTHQMCVHTFA